jgi:hypothetical protein
VGFGATKQSLLPSGISESKRLKVGTPPFNVRQSKHVSITNTDNVKSIKMEMTEEQERRHAKEWKSAGRRTSSSKARNKSFNLWLMEKDSVG